MWERGDLLALRMDRGHVPRDAVASGSQKSQDSSLSLKSLQKEQP